MNFSEMRSKVQAEGWDLNFRSSDNTSGTFTQSFNGTTVCMKVFAARAEGKWLCELFYLPDQQLLLQVSTTNPISWPHKNFGTILDRLLRYARACEAANL